MKGWAMTDELTIAYMKGREEGRAMAGSFAKSLVESLIRPYSNVSDISLEDIAQERNTSALFSSNHALAILSARNFLCQADASAKGEASAAQAPSQIARPLDEWHEDMGPVIWWFFPMTEAPYVGSPLDCGAPVEVVTRYYEKCKVVEKLTRHNVGGWPGYHTHWTPMPQLPRQIEDPSEADNV
jgi:hypothetical protein